MKQKEQPYLPNWKAGIVCYSFTIKPGMSYGKVTLLSKGIPRRNRISIVCSIIYIHSSGKGRPCRPSPMGLSGLGYNGHVFWDAELWMYPAILVLHPEMAKSMIEYRFQRLDAARRNAFSKGFKGCDVSMGKRGNRSGRNARVGIERPL